jgi:hypothetical protein
LGKLRRNARNVEAIMIQDLIQVKNFLFLESPSKISTEVNISEWVGDTPRNKTYQLTTVKQLDDAL